MFFESVNMDMYGKIMDDIIARTNGLYEEMSYSDKVVVITIMKEIKKVMDNYMKEQYNIVKTWASLDIRDIQLEQKEPDWSHLYKDSFSEQFNKLMGNL